MKKTLTLIALLGVLAPLSTFAETTAKKSENKMMTGNMSDKMKRASSTMPTAFLAELKALRAEREQKMKTLNEEFITKEKALAAKYNIPLTDKKMATSTKERLGEAKKNLPPTKAKKTNSENGQ